MPLSFSLLLVLIAASILGGIMGYAFARLGDRARIAAAVSAAEERYSALKSESSSELAAVELALTRERGRATQARQEFQDRQTSLQAKHEASEIYARAQKKQIDTLVDAQQETEDRRKRLERQLRTLRSELRIDDSLDAGSGLAHSSDDNAVVPVLNRRVKPGLAEESTTGGNELDAFDRHAAAVRSTLWGDLTVLRESELPEFMIVEDILDEV